MGRTRFQHFQNVISRWFDRRRGLALGLTLFGIGSGAILMPALAQRLIVLLGWRSTYTVMGLLVLIVSLPVVGLFLKDSPEEMGLLPDGASLAIKAAQKQNSEEGLTWRDATHEMLIATKSGKAPVVAAEARSGLSDVGKSSAAHDAASALTFRGSPSKQSSTTERSVKAPAFAWGAWLPPRPIPGPNQSSNDGEGGPKGNPQPALNPPGLGGLAGQFLALCWFGSFSHDPGSGLAGVQRLALMRVELGFDNSLCLVDIERLELRITGFTDADYGNVLRYDPETTFWHEHRLSGSSVGRIPIGIIAFTNQGG